MSQAKLREALTGGGSNQKDKGPPVADGVLSVEPESSEAIEWRARRSVIDSIASCSTYLDEDDDEQQPGDLYGKFTWKIDKFSDVNKRELRSATFEVGSYKWYILVYPQGCDVANHLSLFLCVADYDKLLPGWAHFAQFTIAVVNKDPKKSKYSDTLHRFCKKEHDWGWKKFMELSKVMEGFTPQDSLVIKAQVQIIRDRPAHPFKCLDAQYRRELVRVYLTNVETICRRFVEERKESLRRLLNDGFRQFWRSLSPLQQLERTQGRTDVVLKSVVKKFLNEKDVTSTLVMDALYCGCKLLEEAGRAFLLAQHAQQGQQAEQQPLWGGILIDSQRNMFFFAGEAISVVERVVEEAIPPFTPDPKADTLGLRHAQEADDYTRDSMERDERRLCDLGRRTVEIFAASYVASNLMEVAWREDDVLRRQDELIKEEERAERAEQLRRTAKAEAEKEKRARKKEKQKQKKEVERARREAEEAERAQHEEARRAEQERRNREAEDKRRALEEQREEDRTRAKQAQQAQQQQEQQARRKAAHSAKAAKQQQQAEQAESAPAHQLEAAAAKAEQELWQGDGEGEGEDKEASGSGSLHSAGTAGTAAGRSREQPSSSYAGPASPAGSVPLPDCEDSEGFHSLTNGLSHWGDGEVDGEGVGPSRAWQYSTAASSTGCSTVQNSVATSRAATPEGPYGLRPQRQPSAGTSARTAGSTLSTVSGSDVSAEDEELALDPPFSPPNDVQVESLRGQVRWLQETLSLRDGTIGALRQRVAELEAQLAATSQSTSPAGAACLPRPASGQSSTAAGAEASNGLGSQRPPPAENGYSAAVAVAAAAPAAAKAGGAQRHGSVPSSSAVGSTAQRAGSAQRLRMQPELAAAGQQPSPAASGQLPFPGPGVGLPPSAAILASASMQQSQHSTQQAQQAPPRAMPRQQSAPLLGRTRHGTPGAAVQPQPVPQQGRARGQGGTAGMAPASAAATPLNSQAPQFNPAPPGAGVLHAQQAQPPQVFGGGGPAPSGGKAPPPPRGGSGGGSAGGVYGAPPVGTMGADAAAGRGFRSSSPNVRQQAGGAGAGAMPTQQPLRGAGGPGRGLGSPSPAGGRGTLPPPPPPLGAASQHEGGMFPGRLPPQERAPFTPPPPTAKRADLPQAAADSPGLDDFAHMGLITDLLD